MPLNLLTFKQFFPFLLFLFYVETQIELSCCKQMKNIYANFCSCSIKIAIANEAKNGRRDRQCPHWEYKNIYANPLNDKQLIKMIYVNVSMAFNATHNTIK